MSALEEFVGAIAHELGGRLELQGETLVLELPGWQPINIDLDPEEPRVSHDRLELVEKQAAIALLAEPGSFAVSVRDEAWKRKRRVTMVRLAFGYYVLNGARCFQRYTAYYENENKIGAVLIGNDNLFSSCTESVELRPDQTEINFARSRLITLLQSASQHFVADNRQAQEFQAMADQQRTRFFELDLLYRRVSKRHVRTFGMDLNDLRSRPPSVSDEYHRRRLDILSQSVPKVATTILSIGTVNSPVKGRLKQMEMPFLPQPTDEKWLRRWQS